MKIWQSIRRSAGEVCCLLLLAGAAPAAAQTDTASIVGTVQDGSGAVLPGVTVTATLQGSGVVTSVVTNTSGQYVFPALRVGQYELAAELEGFRRAVRRDVGLNVQDRLEVGFTMEVGALTEVLEVKGGAPILQTQTADIGNVVSERQIRDLPLLGRRYSELAYLTPGVVTAPGGITSRGEDTFFNANGNYATWNNYTLDGADNNSMSTNLQDRSPQVVQPPVDALQEFKVQTRTYSAEFGKSAGAVINASIKSGTNNLSGSAFTFYRNDALNANTWDNNRVGIKKGPFTQNIPGFTLGGPILQNRMFFFGDYQATRTERTVTASASVPTARMRTGDLSELTGNMTTNNPFVPAGCLTPATRQVNPSCITPEATKLLTLYPLPNAPGIANNWVSNGLLTNKINQFDVRVDHNVSNVDKAFVRYSFQDTKMVAPPVLGNPVASGDFSSDIANRGQSMVASWSRIFGGAVFSEFRFGLNDVNSAVRQLSFGMDVLDEYGIKGVPRDDRFVGGLPPINIARFARIGGPGFRPQFQYSRAYQFSEVLTWNRGLHTYKFGIERRRDNLNYIDLRALNGEVSFTDGRYTGFGYADFLLGLGTSQRLTLFHSPDLYTDGWQGYAQDSWRVANTLTINYGLRYEYFTPMFDRSAKLTNIDPSNGQVMLAKSEGSVFERTLIHPDRNNFAPRIGIAWTATPRMVVRGGYGTFYQASDRYGSESQLGLNLPQLVDASIEALNGNQAPAFTFNQGFIALSPENVSPAVVQWRIQDPDQVTPIVHQFSFGPEYQLGENMAMALEYVGNMTRNGRRLRNINQGIIGTPGVGPVTFPYAQYGYGNAYLEQIVTNGRTNYHSLQANVKRRMSDGLAFTVAYTWSKAMGDFLDHLSAGSGATGNTPRNAYDMRGDYGPLPFDIPHRLVTSFVYELPVGDGRAINPGGVAGALLGGWAVNGILTLNAGRPFSVSANDLAATGQGRRAAANCIADPLPDGFEQTNARWFDTSAFSAPGNFTYGDCGYNTLRGPGSRSMNLSVFRSIRFPGNRRLELRLETFNLFNWVNYGFPGANVSNPNTFGLITSTNSDPRELQLGVKFYF